jgi:hypothetical protein
VLINNFGRLHPGTRTLVRACAGRPLQYATARALLRGFLRSPVAGRARWATEKVCGIYANLLYWHASGEALGMDRLDKVLNGDEPPIS